MPLVTGPSGNIQPVQIPDMVGNYARVMQLKNMMQNEPLQHQILQSQAQSADASAQIAQQQVQDSKGMSSWFSNLDPTDKNQLDPVTVGRNLAQAGVSGAGIMKVQQGLLQQRQTYSEIAKNDAATGGSNLKNLMTKNDIISGALNNVLSSPDEQLPQNIVATAQKLGQQGVFNPDQVQQAQQIAQSGDIPGMRKQLGAMSKGMLANSQIMKESQQQATTNEAIANTNKINQETQYGPTGDAAKAQYQYILRKAEMGQPLSPVETATAKAYEAAQAKTSTQSDTLGITSLNSSRPGGLASAMGSRMMAAPAAAPQGAPAGTLPGAPPQGAGAPQRSTPLLPASNLPSQNATSPAAVKSSMVDLIGQYGADPQLMSRLLYKHPDIIGLVHQKYPNWDQTNYVAKNALMRGFTSGTGAKEINAINVAMGHVGVLDSAIDALNNGNVQLLNKIGNSLGVAIGNTPQTTFQTIVHRVGPEITSAYIPGQGGETERIANQGDFALNMAPQQLHANAAVTVQLLRSKVGALENQYQHTVGRNDFSQRFITPEAQAAFTKFSGSPVGGGQGGIGVGSVIMQNGHQYKVTAVDNNGKPTSADPVNQ